MFTWLKRAVRQLTGRGGKGHREAEFLGYEAYFTLPGIRPAGPSREGRPATARKPMPRRKAA